MDAERELIDVRALAAEIEDANLWVWHTTVEAGLGVWLSRSALSVSVLSPPHCLIRFDLRFAQYFSVTNIRCVLHTLFLQ